MIILPLIAPETYWGQLQPLASPMHARQWRGDDFRNTSPYHIHETSPVPLGSEAAEPRDEWNTDIEPTEPPKEVIDMDFEDSVIRAAARANAMRRADTAMELLAWVIAAALFGAFGLALWGMVS